MPFENAKHPILCLFLVLILLIAASFGVAYLNYYNYFYFMKQFPFVSLEDPTPFEDLLPIAQINALTQQVEETPMPTAQPKLTAYEKLLAREDFIEIDPDTYTYTGLDNLTCYSAPNGGGYAVCTLTSGSHVIIVGQEKDQSVLMVAENVFAYADADQFEQGERYASIEGAVDLRGFLPHAVFKLDYASSDNITERALYPGIPLLEENAAIRLLEASQRFYNDGFTIVIRDAYRPITAQFALWEKVPDTKYIVDPNKNVSWHNVGRAVDISLIDNASGQEVELPSPVYDFTNHSFRNNSDTWTDEAVRNVNYITAVMQSVGFDTVESMWWHYELTDPDLPELENILNYGAIRYEAAN